ncbi:MAG: peptidyl-prolyl cis-trans isomerase, partial [Akkermansiaceae bacterium]|nr:peptidyl-prolyl cis-trans isomerase [Akkermansiaceae bacterium]
PAESPKPAETTAPAETGSQGDPGQPGDPAPAPTPEAPTPATTQPGTTGNPLIAKPNIGAGVGPIAVPPGQPNATTTQPIPALPKTAKEKLNGAEKKQAIETEIPRVNEFFQELADNLGRDFEKLAAKHGLKVIKTSLFSKANSPKELNVSIQNSNIGKLSDSIFLLPSVGDPDEKLSDPHQTPDGWFIGRLDEVTESTPLSFEEARTKVSIDLKKKLAREQMVTDAKALHEKLSPALKAGKTFEEAAKEAGQKIVKLDALKETGSFQGQRFPNPPAFDAAKFTNPGELAPLEFSPSEEEASRALVVFVEKREVTKNDEYLTGLEDSFKGLSDVTRLIAFENWLNDRYAESEVVPPQLAEQ